METAAHALTTSLLLASVTQGGVTGECENPSTPGEVVIAKGGAVQQQRKPHRRNDEACCFV